MGCSKTNPSIDPIEENKPVITLNEISSFNVHTDLQQSFFDDEDMNNVHNYATGIEELSYPRYLNLSFNKRISKAMIFMLIYLKIKNSLHLRDIRLMIILFL